MVLSRSNRRSTNDTNLNLFQTCGFCDDLKSNMTVIFWQGISDWSISCRCKSDEWYWPLKSLWLFSSSHCYILTCDKILYHFRYEIYMFAYWLFFLMDVEFCHLGNCLKTHVTFWDLGKWPKTFFCVLYFFCYRDRIFI